jgi:predicted nucleotide-binding protein
VTESVDIILRNARQANSIVVAVGSGLSAAAGVPDWKSLIANTELAGVYEDTVAIRETGQPSSLQSATWTIQRQVANLVNKAVDEAVPTPAHLAIARLAPRAIVTTNYDTLIEDAINETGNRAFTLTNNDAIESEPEGAIPIFKIFGSVQDPTSISFGFADSMLSSSEMQPTTRLLRAVIAVSLVIAVGFELNSNDLGGLYERFGDRVHGSWFVIPSDTKPDRIAKTLWTNRGVQIVEVPGANLSYFFESLKSRIETLLEPSHPVRQGRQIFVSHAGDSVASSVVYRLLRDLNLNPVDVSDIPVSGQTLMERLDYLAESSEAAIVILGPESSGDRATSANVLFELGWLLGKLGRDRVLTVVTPEAILPSDLGGFRYFVFEPTRRESLRARLRNWVEEIGQGEA